MRAIVLRALPVDEVEVELLEAELGHARVERPHRFVVAVVRVPQLGRHINRLPRQTALRQRRRRLCLIGIHRSTVDMPIADPQGLGGGLLGLRRRYLPQPEADLRNGRAVVEGDIRDDAGVNGHGSPRLSFSVGRPEPSGPDRWAQDSC